MGLDIGIGPPLWIPNAAALVGGGGAAWTPASLGSRLKGWWEVGDLSTLFKDTAGSTPVSADGDAIARINDKSGSGNFLSQATSGNRPVYHTGTNPKATFNGSSSRLDGVAGATITDANGQWCFIAALKLAALTDEIISCVDNLGGTGVVPMLAAITPTTGVPYVRGKYVNTATVTDTAAAVDTTQPYVLFSQAFGTVSPAEVEMFKDGVSDGSSSTTSTLVSGTGTIYIGDYPGNGTVLNGDLYFAALVAGALTAGERASLITYAGSKCGRSL
jgi:hypothetical protein